MANLLTRIFSPLRKAAEGQYRPGPYQINYGGSEGAGWLPAGSPVNYWQHGTSLRSSGANNAMVEACVGAYSQTVAQCPGDHWRSLDNGGRERVTNSDLCRILREPNDYQSISDFLLNLTRNLYSMGEAFAYVVRNNRGEVDSLHLMRNGVATVASDGSIFYGVQGNEIAEMRYDLALPIPARDMLHVRLHTPKHPLIGISPILSTALGLMMSGAVLDQQIAYYINQARPSFILESDLEMNKDQRNELRKEWNEVTQGANAGRTPILTHGLKANAITTTAADGQLADLLKMTDQSIALAFRMPLQVLGIGGTPFASTEALMQSWKSQGLGFCLNHIEEAFGLLFRLRGQPDEYVEFNTETLLRSAFKDRIDGLTKAVMGGVYSVNEARLLESLPAADDGDEPRLQAQVVPISAWDQPKPNMPTAPSAASSAATSADDAAASDEQNKRMLLYFRTTADAHARHVV